MEKQRYDGKFNGYFRIKSFSEHRQRHHEEFVFHHDLKKFMFLVKLIPLLFLVIIALISYLLYTLFKLNFPIMILVFFLTIILLREIGTVALIYSLRNRIIEPIENLKRGVDEIAKGNYGYKIDCCFPPNEIGELFMAFNRMSDELRDAHEAKAQYEQNRRELIAGISHDLKTPITSIMGYIEGINEGVANTPEKLKSYTDIIYYNASYTNQLIDDLFLFSKLDIRQVEFDMKTVEIKDYLRDVFQEKEIELRENGVDLRVVDLVLEGTQAEIDSKMIHRVISNILGNAVKYKGSEKTCIEAVFENIENGIRVSIKDNGPGIEEEKLELIFDRFYRIDPSRSKDVGGSGLGLAIARELVEAHGGKIYAISEGGCGTTMVFTLRSINSR